MADRSSRVRHIATISAVTVRLSLALALAPLDRGDRREQVIEHPDGAAALERRDCDDRQKAWRPVLRIDHHGVGDGVVVLSSKPRI